MHETRHASLIAIVGSTALMVGAPPTNADAAEAGMIVASLGSPLPDEPLALPTPHLLDGADATIGEITISNGSIFDLTNPDEDKALFRLANKLHIVTRPDVIQQQLLFESGDEFSSQLLEESERMLRENRYLQDVTIEPVTYENGVVDIDVKTSDVWTLTPKLSVGRAGGENKVSIGIRETNLLGTGTAVQALYRSDIDRDSRIITFVDRNLGSSWYSLSAGYTDNSDGQSYFLNLEKPFYSLGSKSALGVSIQDFDRIDSLYESGEIAAAFRHKGTAQEVFRGWSKGLQGGWATRHTIGLASEKHRFSAAGESVYRTAIVPEDRTLIYPFVGIELLQDKFEKTKNLDQISRTEDRFLGSRLSLRLGMARADLGSDRSAWIINVGGQTGFGNSKQSSLILSATLDARIENAGVQNLLVGMNARFYKRQSEHRLLYAGFSGTYGDSLDLDQYLSLGGDNGLRGYPLRYQTGDKRALFTLEQRFFTDWYPLRLFRVGGAIFFDVGRAWGDSPVPIEDRQVLKDIGFGLRLGNTRSGLGRVIHIDLAFPLDGNNTIADVQFLVSTKQSF